MLKKNQIRDMFEDKTILITGGLGSIGSEIVKQVLNYCPKEVRVLDNRETELFYFKRKFEKVHNMSFLFGDVRDMDRLIELTNDVDIIFHAAAMKHVILCEYNPFEAIKTNVIGTQNIIKCALDNKVEKVILISTDKAVNPTNVMGATKLLAERLVSAACYYNRGPSKFGVVRFGNVLATRGSVLEVWQTQLNEGKKITVTNPEMTRFFMDVEESVKLIFQAAYYAENGEVFILKMPSVKIGVLAEAFLEVMGYPPDHFEIVGMRIGEKMHEELISKNESDLLLESEDLFVRLPIIFSEYTEYIKTNEYLRFVKLGFKKASVSGFSSNNDEYLLSKDQIKNVLKKMLKPEID
ncbi:Polysaccharide biosynthesis protein [Geoglobus ahangari]|uniref:Polysaccharide biosynthesis protein n=1 Tax=Geoglobus ahangari TaxID=113653 RepID=A0A0F7IEX2_9EURY|nr:polysaccharide biosynthesis protein [Geoglobus ahangari]AKG91242.1 Polysaccharide biosynthesis protein [Geoglobus ahangari]